MNEKFEVINACQWTHLNERVHIIVVKKEKHELVVARYCIGLAISTLKWQTKSMLHRQWSLSLQSGKDPRANKGSDR